MESRLMKPKVTLLRKGPESSEGKGGPTSLHDEPPAVPKQIKSSRILCLGKSKSTLHIGKHASEESSLPPKQPLVRSRTSSAIARSGQPKVGSKRLGTGGTVTETKRAAIHSATEKASNGPGSSHGSGIPGATGGHRPVALRPSKWDLRGRLDLCNAELARLKEKHRACAKLENIANELRSRETTASAKVAEMEHATSGLSEELEAAKRKYLTSLRNHEDTKIKLEESELSRRRASEALRNSEMTYEAQNKIIAEQARKEATFETLVNEHANSNAELRRKAENLQSLIHAMDKDRRVLHNVVQELKGNVRVYCRVRPRLPKESKKIRCPINFIDECTMEIGHADSSSDSLSYAGRPRTTKQEFSFDKIFPPSATQAELFEEFSSLVLSALEGINVCVFAYGQTGSGKTYTMEGGETSEAEGLIPRAARQVFQEMKQFQLLGWCYKVEASILEIHNEHIVDLLDAQRKHHEIRMTDISGHDLYVTNLRIVEIDSPKELHECLRTARQNRCLTNNETSRSHTLVRIRLVGTHVARNERSVGYLNLVDLAGSERLKSEEATRNVDKTLATLGNVIAARLKRQDHTAYRNSKLTHLLMPSLGGNSKTLVLLNLSPLDESFNETLNSLRFASNIVSCKTGQMKRAKSMLNNST